MQTSSFLEFIGIVTCLALAALAIIGIAQCLFAIFEARDGVRTLLARKVKK